MAAVRQGWDPQAVRERCKPAAGQQSIAYALCHRRRDLADLVHAPAHAQPVRTIKIVREIQCEQVTRIVMAVRVIDQPERLQVAERNRTRGPGRHHQTQTLPPHPLRVDAGMARVAVGDPQIETPVQHCGKNLSLQRP